MFINFKKIPAIIFFILLFLILVPALAYAGNPPSAVFDRLPNDVSADIQPTLTGIATADGSTITSIECRVNGGAWAPAQPLDGVFDRPQERFSWRPARALDRSSIQHLLEARCYDAAGNFNTLFPLYHFYVTGDQPVIDLKSKAIDLVNGDTIDREPQFDIMIVSANPPVTARQSILKDSWPQEQTTNLNLGVDPNNPDIFYGQYAPTLDDGSYKIKIEALDNGGKSTVLEVNRLIVRHDSDLNLQSQPLCFPNPFYPSSGQSLSISYVLTKSSDITLTIYDLMVGQIFKRLYSQGNNGGKAGYNEVTWDGHDDADKRVGNGIYVFIVIGEGRVLGKGKVTVLTK